MKKFLTIAGVFAFILFIPYMVMYPNIKKTREKHRLEAEYSKYLKMYSNLQMDDLEEYLKESYGIYIGLCDVVEDCAAELEYDDVGQKAEDILMEINQRQVLIISGVKDILKQKEYIDTILSPELDRLHKAHDAYEKEVMKSLYSLYGASPKTFKQLSNQKSK